MPIRLPLLTIRQNGRWHKSSTYSRPLPFGLKSYFGQKRQGTSWVFWCVKFLRSCSFCVSVVPAFPTVCSMCFNTVMDGKENKEGRLEWVMLNGSSWVTDKAFLERRGSRMECVDEGRLQNCTGRCAKHKRSGRCNAYLWRSNGCGQEGCGFGLLILLEAKRKDRRTRGQYRSAVGKLQRWTANLCSLCLTLGRLDNKEWGIDGSSDIAYKRCASPVAKGVRCQHGARNLCARKVVP